MTEDVPQGRQIARQLGLEPLIPEGGHFRRMYAERGITAIHYLLAGDDFSALHRMRTSDELYFFHAGAPLRVLLLEPHAPREVLLGADPAAGQQATLTVPAGVWQGGRSTGGWSLVSTVVVPGFEWDDFELASADVVAALAEHFVDLGSAIRDLTPRG